jgi:hypothetical protein
MRDALAEEGYQDDELQECVETLIVNAKFLGLLRTTAGSERMVSIDQLIDELPSRSSSQGHRPARRRLQRRTVLSPPRPTATGRASASSLPPSATTPAKCANTPT